MKEEEELKLESLVELKRALREKIGRTHPATSAYDALVDTLADTQEEIDKLVQRLYPDNR